MNSKRIKSQPITVQLELLSDEAIWSIFEAYGSTMTREQLKVVYRSIDDYALEFDEWLIENGLEGKIKKTT